MKDNRGHVMVEFALAFPLLMLLCVGTTDLGRAFFQGVTAVHASSAGAFAGSRDGMRATFYDAMKAAAVNDAGRMSLSKVEASHYCECPDGTRLSCSTGTCSGYGEPRLYVRTRTARTFDSIVRYPGIPVNFAIGNETFVRVQ